MKTNYRRVDLKNLRNTFRGGDSLAATEKIFCVEQGVNPECLFLTAPCVAVTLRNRHSLCSTSLCYHMPRVSYVDDTGTVCMLFLSP